MSHPCRLYLIDHSGYLNSLEVSAPGEERVAHVGHQVTDVVAGLSDLKLAQLNVDSLFGEGEMFGL